MPPACPPPTARSSRGTCRCSSRKSVSRDAADCGSPTKSGSRSRRRPASCSCIASRTTIPCWSPFSSIRRRIWCRAVGVHRGASSLKIRRPVSGNRGSMASWSWSGTACSPAPPISTTGTTSCCTSSRTSWTRRATPATARRCSPDARCTWRGRACWGASSTNWCAIRRGIIVRSWTRTARPTRPNSSRSRRRRSSRSRGSCGRSIPSSIPNSGSSTVRTRRC